VFGAGYAGAHPEIIAAVMYGASLDWAAMMVTQARPTASGRNATM
jgi:hypothetical protein